MKAKAGKGFPSAPRRRANTAVVRLAPCDQSELQRVQPATKRDLVKAAQRLERGAIR